MGMVAHSELRHRVMHRLVFLVFQFQRHDGQAVEEEDEINFLIGLAEVEVWSKGNAVIAIFACGCALIGAGLWIEKTKLQSAHF